MLLMETLLDLRHWRGFAKIYLRYMLLLLSAQEFILKVYHINKKLHMYGIWHSELIVYNHKTLKLPE